MQMWIQIQGDSNLKNLKFYNVHPQSQEILLLFYPITCKSFVSYTTNIFVFKLAVKLPALPMQFIFATSRKKCFLKDATTLKGM